MERKYIDQLLALGYNAMPINEDKTPRQGWKKYQDEKINTLDEFRSITDYYALICGFNDVEVIDVDLKVLASKKERDDFWHDLKTMLCDNLDDFLKRFLIKQTKSGGYHIIYRAKNIEGNLKLARLTDHQEAIIETRGVGGYVCMYDNVINFNYHDIKLISDDEREIIISCCRTFNDHHEKPIEVKLTVEKQYKTHEKTVTPWDDFNAKNSILDVVGVDFSIVKDLSNKVLIRRHGAKSPHSGYIFKNSGCMYLFSTGTQYEAQKLYTPFMAYAVNDFSGDFSRAASHLYAKGYGDRRKPTLDPSKKIELPEYKLDEADFPLDIFPNELANYMVQSNRTLNNSIDYMGCSFMWLCSLVVGNSFVMKVKTGWFEISTLWIALVGQAGVGKSPSIKSITYPLMKINGEEKRRYQKKKIEYDEYLALSKKEKKDIPEVEKPKRTQFIVDDVTIEALLDLHDQNPHGVGVMKDELAGWFKDMNKYKDGSDKEQWLSTWSGDGVSVDRITRQSNYIARPIMPVLGGIQPLILTQFFTDENKDSGFLDRMLFSAPEIKVEKYVKEHMKQTDLDYYNNWVLFFFTEARRISNFDENGDIIPIECTFLTDAETEWIRIFDEITTRQNSDDTPEFLKPLLAKMKSYTCRFALILSIMHGMNTGDVDLTVVTKDSILKAEKLTRYFIAMAEKMMSINRENAEQKSILLNNKFSDPVERIKKVMEAKGDKLNKASLAKELGISRKHLYTIIEKIKCN